MIIVSSITESADVQADGRRSVHEIHTDDAGNQYERTWMAEAGDDINAAREAYARRLETASAK